MDSQTGVIDLRGKSCPVDLIEAKRVLERCRQGATMMILATDPEFPKSLGVFLSADGASIVDARVEERIGVRREREKAAACSRPKISIARFGWCGGAGPALRLDSRIAPALAHGNDDERNERRRQEQRSEIERCVAGRDAIQPA